MAQMTLDRAARLQASIRREIGKLDFNPDAQIPVFGDPWTAAEEQSELLGMALLTLTQHLSALETLRAVCGNAMTEFGIGALLAERNRIQEWLGLVQPLVRQRKRYDEDDALPLDHAVIAETTAALRKRYEGEGLAKLTLSVSRMTEASKAMLRHEIATRQRRLDQIQDQLRQANAKLINIPTNVIEYLEEQSIV